MKHEILLSIIIVIVFLISACTTRMLLNSRIESGSLIRELSNDQYTYGHHRLDYNGYSYMKGDFIGNTELNGYKYARILIYNPRLCISQKHQIEMLIPLTQDKKVHSFLIENNESISENMHPVNVIFKISYEGKAREKLQKEGWNGYPANIVLKTSTNLTVLYRIGPDQIDVREDKIEDKLNWVCRSHVEHNIWFTVLPITVAIDIITSPVQLILFLFI